jgi:hypothetical protein
VWARLLTARSLPRAAVSRLAFAASRTQPLPAAESPRQPVSQLDGRRFRDVRLPPLALAQALEGFACRIRGLATQVVLSGHEEGGIASRTWLAAILTVGCHGDVRAAKIVKSYGCGFADLVK